MRLVTTHLAKLGESRASIHHVEKEKEMGGLELCFVTEGSKCADV